jgi:RNA polymerase sigma-70 factor (ECF subfamily)
MPVEFEEAYRRYKDRLYSYVLSIVEGASAAEDVVQEVFGAFYARAHTLRVEGALRSFLYACAHHRAIDYLRRRPRGQRPLPEGLSAPPCPVPDEADRDLIRRALRSLAPEQREVVFLKAYEEMTLEEIADVLDAPLGTIAARYHRALEKLRSILEPVWEIHR